MSQETSAESTPATVESEQPLRHVHRDGVEYTIIGTAHVSRASADAVSEMAQSGDYEAIAVELCQARYEALTAERKWTDLDLYKIIRDGKAGLVMANLALSAYQRRIADQFGIEPGAEMKAAVMVAKGAARPDQTSLDFLFEPLPAGELVAVGGPLLANSLRKSFGYTLALAPVSGSGL